MQTEQQPLILICYKKIETVSHLTACSDKPLIYSYRFRITFLQAPVSINKGREASLFLNGIIKINELSKKLETSNHWYFTDGYKTQGCNSVRVASVTSTAPMVNLYRTSKYSSIFTAEAMAIILVLEKIKKKRQDKCCSIFETRKVFWKPFDDSAHSSSAISLYSLSKRSSCG
jgi:hypothetical protein